MEKKSTDEKARAFFQHTSRTSIEPRRHKSNLSTSFSRYLHSIFWAKPMSHCIVTLIWLPENYAL